VSKDFPIFAAAIFGRFAAMSARELLIVDDPDLFDVYLAAFPEGTNPIFRTRTEHDGSIDKQFIRNLGRCVVIVDGQIETVWDGLASTMPHPYNVVSAEMAMHVASLPIAGVFRTNERKFGLVSNVALLDMADPAGGPASPRAHTFHHFHGDVATRHWSATPDAARGTINTTVQVFKRGLDELTTLAFDTVLELIDANSLYRGAEFRKAVAEFREMLSKYRALNSDAARSLFAWEHFDSPAARFRNTAIGTLVTDLSEGMELDKAVRVFESKVAPENYKRTTALITPRMIEQAVETLRGLGLESATERRFARASDVSVNNVLFVDNRVRPAMKDGLVGLLSADLKPVPVKVDDATPITIDEFMSKVVPNVSSIDLVVGNEHLSNFVSLTAPVHADAGRLFKWSNGFAWAYDGDAADSIKQRVKRAGGKIDAEVRVSLSWSNTDDLDLHVVEPHGGRIHFAAKRSFQSDGVLDVDMNVNSLRAVRDPVENVVWNRPMPDGAYFVMVHQFTQRESVDVGFAIEVEAHGTVQTFVYPQAVRSRGTVNALVLTVKGGRVVAVNAGAAMKAGQGSTVSKDHWGVQTSVLTPVDMLLASPNHWDGEGVGNKHWFFMLKGCKNPEPARGIYNEFLRGDLEPHRKVFEVLGAKTKCPVTDDQLSGVGFSCTRHDKAVVVVKGVINRAFKIQF
jgi:hypothetical protein